MLGHNGLNFLRSYLDLKGISAKKMPYLDLPILLFGMGKEHWKKGVGESSNCTSLLWQSLAVLGDCKRRLWKPPAKYHKLPPALLPPPQKPSTIPPLNDPHPCMGMCRSAQYCGEICRGKFGSRDGGGFQGLKFCHHESALSLTLLSSPRSSVHGACRQDKQLVWAYSVEKFVRSFRTQKAMKNNFFAGGSRNYQQDV